MPLQSKAQWRKWGALLTEGKVSRKQFDEATKVSRPYKSLPERLQQKPTVARAK